MASRKPFDNKAYLKKWWAKQTPEERAIRKHKYAIKYKFKMTSTEYKKLYDEQGGKCALCETHESDLTKKLCVDHCHKTGNIRGLLCLRCNSSLAQFGDNVKGLKKALNYLEKMK